MKLTAFLYVVFVLVAGCGDRDPRDDCQIFRREIAQARAFRECNENFGCLLSGKEFALMRLMESEYPQCFTTEVERAF